MKAIFILLITLCCLPYLVHSQITRQEIDKKDKNKTIIYKIEGSSDLDILNQLDPDVEIGQEIQIAWEKPNQAQAKPEQIKVPKPKSAEITKVVEQKKVVPLSVTKTSSTTQHQVSSSMKSPTVFAMSNKKYRKKKRFKAFSKTPKKQHRKNRNRKKCYKF